MIKARRMLTKTNNKPTLPRSAKNASMADAEAKLGKVGLDTSKMEARARSRSRYDLLFLVFVLPRILEIRRPFDSI